MRFVFDYSRVATGTRPTEVHLYQCGSDPTCAEMWLLPEVPGQRLECEADTCAVALLTATEYYRLEAVFPDRVRSSEPFEKIGFYTTFRVFVLQDALEVVLEEAAEQFFLQEETLPSSGPLRVPLELTGFALLGTLLIETVVGAIYLWRTRRSWIIVLWIILVNLLTVPVVWLVVPVLPLPLPVLIFLPLVVVILVEAAILALLAPRRLRLRGAMALSLLMNLASFIIGVLFLGLLVSV